VLDRLAGRPFREPPPATAIGALHRHLTGDAHPPGAEYQPTNVVFALFPPLTGKHRGKQARKAGHAARARREIEPWLAR
jgi:methylenetetrahydrofolate--tRNA-(uracil-5-)-methyltransferase